MVVDKRKTEKEGRSCYNLDGLKIENDSCLLDPVNVIASSGSAFRGLFFLDSVANMLESL